MATLRLYSPHDDKQLARLRQRGHDLIEGFRKKIATRLRKAGYKVPRKNLLTQIDGYYMQVKFDFYGFGRHGDYMVTDDKRSPIICVVVQSHRHGFKRRLKMNGSFPIDEVYDEIVRVVEAEKVRREGDQEERTQRKRLSKFLETLGITVHVSLNGTGSIPGLGIHAHGDYRHEDVVFTFSVEMEDRERIAAVINFLRETFPETEDSE